MVFFCRNKSILTRIVLPRSTDLCPSMSRAITPPTLPTTTTRWRRATSQSGTWAKTQVRVQYIQCPHLSFPKFRSNLKKDLAADVSYHLVSIARTSVYFMRHAEKLSGNQRDALLIFFSSKLLVSSGQLRSWRMGQPSSTGVKPSWVTNSM